MKTLKIFSRVRKDKEFQTKGPRMHWYSVPEEAWIVLLLYCYCIVVVLLLYCYFIVVVLLLNLLLHCYFIVIVLLLYCYCIVVVLLLYCCCIVIVLFFRYFLSSTVFCYPSMGKCEDGDEDDNDAYELFCRMIDRQSR